MRSNQGGVVLHELHVDPKMRYEEPMRVVLVTDPVHRRGIEDFRSPAIEAAVVDVKMLGINGLDIAADIIDPRNGSAPHGIINLRLEMSPLIDVSFDAAQVAIFPCEDGWIIFVKDARNRIAMFEQCPDVFFESRNDSWVSIELDLIVVTEPQEELVHSWIHSDDPEMEGDLNPTSI